MFFVYVDKSLWCDAITIDVCADCLRNIGVTGKDLINAVYLLGRHDYHCCYAFDSFGERMDIEIFWFSVESYRLNYGHLSV